MKHVAATTRSQALLKARTLSAFRKCAYAHGIILCAGKLDWDTATNLTAARGIAAIALNLGHAHGNFFSGKTGEQIELRALSIAHELMTLSEVILMPVMDSAPDYDEPVAYKSTCCEHRSVLEEAPDFFDSLTPAGLSDIFCTNDTLRCINTVALDVWSYLPKDGPAENFLRRFVRATVSCPHEDGPEKLARLLMNT